MDTSYWKHGLTGLIASWGAAGVSMIDAVEPVLRLVALLLGIAVSAWSLYRMWRQP
jgi:hypothetical protein